MPVTYRTQASNTHTAAKSIQVDKPTGTVENDLLICEIATDGNAVITTLSGWTLIQGGGVNPSDNTPAHGVYYKKATGSEPSTYTWSIDSTESISGCILRYDGQNLTNPINVSGHNESTGSIQPMAPIITTTVDGCMVICSAAMDDDDTPYGTPGLMNERLNLTANTHGHMMADLIQSTQGNTGDYRFSQNTAEEWYCFTIAIAPVGGPQTFYQNSGQGANAPTGILNKQGYKDTGGCATVLVGSLGTASIFLVSVGAYVMAIVGILGTVTTFVRSVGSYAMTLAGGLKRQTHKAVGGYSVTVVGGLARQSFKCIGGYVMTILGTLSTATIFLQTAGQAALAISGGLIKKIFLSVGSGVVNSVGGSVKKLFLLVGSGVIVSIGGLAKKTSIFIGKAVTGILGTLSTTTIILQAAGQAAMVITGSLTSTVTFVRSVGTYAITIAGSLAKKTSICTGKATTSILGVLSTTTTFLQDIGSGNISPTGTLGVIVLFLANVGGAAMNVVGVLSKTFTAGGGAIKRGIALLLQFISK